MFYPIMLNLNEKKCVVIGGGGVSLRKIRELIKCCEDIVVVSPDICQDLAKLWTEGRIKWIKDYYNSKYIQDAFLCFACTDSEEVNKKVLDHCNSEGILVNMADRTNEGSFIVPATRRKMNSIISVSCEDNPAASRYMADYIMSCIEPWMDEYIEMTCALRKKCRECIDNTQTRQSYMKNLFLSEFIELARNDIAKAYVKAEKLLDSLINKEGEKN